MEKIRKLLVALCASFIVCGSAQAYIVDTGEPDPIAGIYVFHPSNYFAGRFTLAQPHRITGMEAFLDNFEGGSGDVAVGIFADDGNLPGSELFSSSFFFPTASGFGWYGVSGLDWTLAAGTYWAGFIPVQGATFETTVFGGAPVEAPMPMDAYVAGSFGGWFHPAPPPAGTPDYLPAVRIDGVMLAVPEPETYALLLAGLGLLGFAARRRR